MTRPLATWPVSRYQKYLSSVEWRNKRGDVLARAKGRCEICGIRPPVNVHHIRYPKRLGDEPLTDLLAVCRRCHERSHGMIEQQQGMVAALSFEGAKIRMAIDDDDRVRFPWTDIERCALSDIGEHAVRAATHSRAKIKHDHMRRGRHWETHEGEDWLYEFGLYAWISAFPKPPEMRDDSKLWRMQHHLEEVAKAYRDGSLLKVEPLQQPEKASKLAWMRATLEQLEAQEQKLTEHEQRIGALESQPALPAPAAANGIDLDEFATVRSCCFSLGHDPDQLRQGRLGLDGVVGRALAAAARRGEIKRGKDVQQRLPDSRQITTFATYRRRDIYVAIRAEMTRAEA